MYKLQGHYVKQNKTDTKDKGHLVSFMSMVAKVIKFTGRERRVVARCWELFVNHCVSVPERKVLRLNAPP